MPIVDLTFLGAVLNDLAPATELHLGSRKVLSAPFADASMVGVDVESVAQLIQTGTRDLILQELDEQIGCHEHLLALKVLSKGVKIP